ncbi:hypothetical protein WT06_07245 [Burkholderia anthina]|nr:hypothetical protein WT06_07245 [Burkholderia anthina]
MIQFTEEQIAARELRNTAYHEAAHKMLYERFGGAGDAVVWKTRAAIQTKVHGWASFVPAPVLR